MSRAQKQITLDPDEYAFLSSVELTHLAMTKSLTVRLIVVGVIVAATRFNLNSTFVQLICLVFIRWLLLVLRVIAQMGI